MYKIQLEPFVHVVLKQVINSSSYTEYFIRLIRCWHRHLQGHHCIFVMFPIHLLIALFHRLSVLFLVVLILILYHHLDHYCTDLNWNLNLNVPLLFFIIVPCITMMYMIFDITIVSITWCF